MSTSLFATIGTTDLVLVNGGGTAWDNYTQRLGQDVTDTKNRASEAMKYNFVNGNLDVGKFSTNAAAMVGNGGKTAVDAVLGGFYPSTYR